MSTLLQRGWSVNALVRHAGRAKDLTAGVRLVRGDLCEEDTLPDAVRGAEVVFHLGAAMAGPWEHYRQITVEGTRILLHVAQECGVRRFVHVSSIIVYDKSNLAPGQRITEDWRMVAPEPAAGPYARSKVEAEAVVRQSDASDLETVIVRPGLVYGRERIVFDHLGAVLGGRFVGVGSRDLLLPLVHVDSLVDALIRLPSSPGGRRDVPRRRRE